MDVLFSNSVHCFSAGMVKTDLMADCLGLGTGRCQQKFTSKC